jgi:fido (protein-threonine AMPylation protein)
LTGPWNEDDPRDSKVILGNLVQILRDIDRDSSLRGLPTVSMAQEWHRQTYQGVRLPVPYYAGEIRDSDSNFPELFGYEVAVGPNQGVPSRLVPEQLAQFEANMQRVVAVLDAAIPVGTKPSDPQIESVVVLCANAHGEWVRIHPFANGNGRTARIWVNWCALRYALPPFIQMKPRPEGILYDIASMNSMLGNHQMMVAVLADMLSLRLRELA